MRTDRELIVDFRNFSKASKGLSSKNISISTLLYFGTAYIVDEFL
jgi:hypothetical protein